MKKNLIVMLLSISAFTGVASAKEVYYVNDNNVSFTKEEYEFLTSMFWKGSQNLMTLEDYDLFIKSDIMNGEITIKEVENIQTYGTVITDNNKTLKIASSCNSNCLISVMATWAKNPPVRSYDVIGAIFSNTYLTNTPTTTVTSSTGTTSSQEIQRFNNGFGVSIALPAYGNSIIVNQNYRVNKGGAVYASYQHALKTISLTNSKNYTLSRSGFGGVFNFSGTAASTYDQAPGVDITT